ncbi:MAG: dethiobiotin synthase [Pseudomonadota bacterium]
MSRIIVVLGTDTEIGKTVLSAALVGALGARYWKPVQSGLDGPESDSETVARLAALGPGRVLPEAYRLTAPLSPHRAAELDRVEIDPDAIRPPPPDPDGRPLVVEGAGGLMVPLTRRRLLVDMVAGWGAPVVLAARTALGTINHTLLSLEALKRRGAPVLGVAFVGDPVPDSEAVIEEISGARRLGRLPRLDPLTPETLAAAFQAGFRREDFEV